MASNGLYGYTPNGNVVAVGNTNGLYIGSGNIAVLNNAEQLFGLLANSSSIGWELVNSNQDVSAVVLSSGVTAGTYGDSTDIPIITVGSDGRITSVTTASVDRKSVV